MIDNEESELTLEKLMAIIKANRNKGEGMNRDNGKKGSTMKEFDGQLYEFLNSVIYEKGIQILKDSDEFFDLLEETYFYNKKTGLFVDLIFREWIIDSVISASALNPDDQEKAISRHARDISREYGIIPSELERVLRSFMKSISYSRLSYRGKRICSQLRDLRILFAETNNIPYYERECTHEGPCNGTCEYCDSKLQELLEAASRLECVDYPYHEIYRNLSEKEEPSKLQDFYPNHGDVDGIIDYYASDNIVGMMRFVGDEEG